ncbi:hypothetical protein H1Q63_20215 [Desmonostoc muscorum CCALA 125]|uniref:Uncharacterized protein n=1 Tax=Desmonostoc muscorum LEGE 12446 TaxID=1828758 RepID=A0A8J7D0C5_DESMC|nr:hypothetical protein [Desmonostoc muscorum]MBX9256225.1 hypothetical protein [Desmonostoc muscorum CCALA 125]MCF2151947.1 hypothetical protein [Desmonostoc muscorum LEGE 12446]
MIEPSDAKQITNDYLEILEALIKKIHLTAKEKGLNPSKEISISVGTEKIYKGTIGDDSLKKINPFVSADLVEKLNTAISNPQNAKGTVSIKIGRTEVFRVKNGKIETDKLGLSVSISQSQKQTPASASIERIYSVEALQKQVEALQNKVNEQQKLVDSLLTQSQLQTQESIVKLTQQVGELFKSLEKQQKLIEKTQQTLSIACERSLPPIQNTKLQNWVGGVESKVKQTAKNIFERVKDALIPKIGKIKNQLEELKRRVNQQFTRAIDDVKSKTIEKSVKALLKHLGTKNADGSITFKSKSFDFKQFGESVTVQAKDGNEVLKDGVLSDTVSDQEIEALDKVQSVVDKYTEASLEYLSYAEQESESLSRGLSR